MWSLSVHSHALGGAEANHSTFLKSYHLARSVLCS